MAIPHSPHFRLLLAKHQLLYMLLNKTGTGKEQKVVVAYWNEAPTYRAHLFSRPFAPLYGWVLGYKTNGGGEGGEGGCRDSCVFPKGGGWSGGVCYGNAYCRTNGLPPLLSRVRGLLRCLLLRGGGEAATVERGMRRKREGWLLDTVAAAALTVSERRSGCGGRGGEPFFLSLLEIPPPSCGAHIKGEREKEKRGGIGGDTHSDICIGRERDLRSLTGMAMFDALFSQSG